MSKYNENIDKELLWEFIDSKGLLNECIKFCQNKQIKAQKAGEQVPVGDRTFFWEGHYSKYCYEVSGENFDHTQSFDDLCDEWSIIPITFYDPSSKDNSRNTIPVDVEVVSLREMEELTKGCVHFDDVYNYLIEYTNGNIGEGSSCYYFDNFGFEYAPTNEQLKEWLEQLRFVKDDITDDTCSEDFFNDRGF